LNQENSCVIDLRLRVSSILQALALVSVAVSAAAGQVPPRAARDLTTGESIYRAGCAGCHGPNGEGAPQTAIGFDKPETFPDFTQCDQTTPELDIDWKATITQGGHGRGFSPIMPSFAEELTPAQVAAVVAYVRGFCRSTSWPRGELNLPRPLTTEKAYPEDETVITSAVTTRHAPDITNEIVYEHRLSIKDQIELSIPFAAVHDENGTLARGVGDVGIAWKRVLFSSRNSILSAQGELIMPTGNKDKGLGTGVTTIEAFAAYGQILPSEMFLQAQGGTEQPTSTDTTPRALFGRVAFGKSFRQEGGLGRLWSPMIELLSDRDLTDGAKTNLDLLPQFQVTLNQRQHIRVSAGLQLPVSNTTGRSKQVVFYFLWDWFDGGLRDGWK
jgi:mono/diheme cytochrome c family protein